MNQYTDQTKAFFNAWEALVRYRWRFILSTFAVMAGVLLGSFLLPRMYKAEAIFERRTDMVLTEIIDQGASKSFQDSQRASLAEEIGGQIAIDEMIETLQAAKDTNTIKDYNHFDLQRLRSEMTKRVSVQFNIGSIDFDRIRVGFIYKDRQLAQDVVNTLVENYISRTRKLIDGRLEQTATFFQSEVDRNREIIEQLENKKLTFEIEHADLLPDSPGSIQMRLADAQKELSQNMHQRDAATMRAKSLRELLDSTPEVVPQIITMRNPELEQLEGKLRELKTQMETYVGVYKMTAKHPDLVAIKDQIAAINQEILNTPDEIVTQKRLGANNNRDNLQVQFTQALASQNAFDKQIDSLKKQISRFNLHSSQLFPVRSDYRKLTRQIEQAQRQQTFWEENLRHVRMALTAEVGNRGVNLDFVKPCTQIGKPVSPNLVQVLMAAIVLGLIGGGINVFFAYRADESFHNGEELAGEFDLPLVGVVSEILSQQEQTKRRMKNLIVYPLNTTAIACLLIMMAGMLYLNLEKPHLYKQFKDNPTHFIGQRLNTDGEKTVGKE
jgi:uncharacterized protein involved in exopolysaccharide biosynthesis